MFGSSVDKRPIISNYTFMVSFGSMLPILTFNIETSDFE